MQFADRYTCNEWTQLHLTVVDRLAQSYTLPTKLSHPDFQWLWYINETLKNEIVPGSSKYSKANINNILFVLQVI